MRTSVGTLVLLAVAGLSQAYQPSVRLRSPCSLALRRVDRVILRAESDDWGEEEQTTPPTAPQTRTEPERDLFVPIFALLSIAGFTAAYAWETLRFVIYPDG